VRREARAPKEPNLPVAKETPKSEPSKKGKFPFVKSVASRIQGCTKSIPSALSRTKDTITTKSVSSARGALAESVIGLFKADVIRRRGPWRRLEHEEAYYRRKYAPAAPAGVTQ